MENKNYLETILPHKKPMVLIDDVLDYSFDEKWLKSVVEIRKDSLFYDDEIKGVSSIIGIEYMAQTVGCYAQLKRNQGEPKLGFLLGTRIYNNLLDVFPLGEVYTIKVQETYSGDDIVSFSCFIYNKKNKEVASATINTYQGDNVENILKNG